MSNARPPSGITLERAIAVIAEAEMALADLDAARRKGYLTDACTTVFAFMDDWRGVRQHAAAIVADGAGTSITSPSTQQAGVPAPADAPKLKTYRCRFTQGRRRLANQQ
jgi:hypothetical protein